MTENTTKSNIFNIIVSIMPIVISLFALLASIIIPIVLQKNNQSVDEDLRIKAAIPAFRIVHDKEADDIMEIFPPHRAPQYVKDKNGNTVGREIYYSIKDFSIQNLSNNLAYFSHIEYDGEAFELINLGLVAKENEVITLSNDNRFVGYMPSSRFYIICRSIYGKYYRYECTLESNGIFGDIRTYTITNIGVAQDYNINNDVYNNMYIHVRDIQLPPNIIF